MTDLHFNEAFASKFKYTESSLEERLTFTLNFRVQMIAKEINIDINCTMQKPEWKIAVQASIQAKKIHYFDTSVLIFFLTLICFLANLYSA